jgi:hypothetical protein
MTRVFYEVNQKTQKYSSLKRLVFELCRLTQRPSLTLHPLGGSTPRLWPLFLLRAKGKRKEMTGTQQVGTLKHQFLQYITLKNVFVLFHYQNNFEMNYSSSIWWRQLFRGWREWESVVNDSSLLFLPQKSSKDSNLRVMTL